MKDLFIYALALLFTLTTFTNCSKDSDDDQDDGTRFTVMLNGSDSFEAQDLFAYALDFGDNINVYGVDATDNDDVIYISIKKDIVEGSFDFGTDYFSLITLDGATYNTSLTGGNGQVTVTSFDGVNIQGTFRFEAVNTDDPSGRLIATDGEFNVDIR